MKCKKFEKYMNLYLDKEIDPAKEADFANHINICAGCGEKFKEYSYMKTLLAETPSFIPRENIASDIRVRLTEVKPAGNFRSYLNLKTSLAFAATLCLVFIIVRFHLPVKPVSVTKELKKDFFRSEESNPVTLKIKRADYFSDADESKDYSLEGISKEADLSVSDLTAATESKDRELTIPNIEKDDKDIKLESKGLGKVVIDEKNISGEVIKDAEGNKVISGANVSLVKKSQPKEKKEQIAALALVVPKDSIDLEIDEGKRKKSIEEIDLKIGKGRAEEGDIYVEYEERPGEIESMREIEDAKSHSYFDNRGYDRKKSGKRINERWAKISAEKREIYRINANELYKKGKYSRAELILKVKDIDKTYARVIKFLYGRNGTLGFHAKTSGSPFRSFSAPSLKAKKKKDKKASNVINIELTRNNYFKFMNFLDELGALSIKLREIDVGGYAGKEKDAKSSRKNNFMSERVKVKLTILKR
jgi:hypothetical protein